MRKDVYFPAAILAALRPLQPGRMMQRLGVETDAFASSSGRLTGLEMT